ncbi:MAG: Uma2 family endonuclease [Gammaproteobacteria bacterium]|nr:Uma2 family endonuclease [Gammaproteobacteria bacterium]
MEAKKLKTIDELEEAWLKDEKIELINGEIVKRPMAKAEHGAVQGDICGELSPFRRKSGPGGWWFMTEISVRYNEHQCPSHDIAGWRKERMPRRPKGVIEIPPDWVCEIVSAGHENKDTLRNFNTLMHYNVPYYWIIWPEEEALIAYKLVEGKYLAVKSIENGGKARIEPFEQIEFDLDYVFGKS